LTLLLLLLLMLLLLLLLFLRSFPQADFTSFPFPLPRLALRGPLSLTHTHLFSLSIKREGRQTRPPARALTIF